MPAVATVIAIQPRFKPMPHKFEVNCASCNLRELCLPAGLCAEDLERVENIVYARRRIKRGEALFNAGAQFSAVYAIRSGFWRSGRSPPQPSGCAWTASTCSASSSSRTR